MPTIKVRASVAGGNSLDLEVENGTPVKEVIEALKEMGFDLRGDISVNGQTVEEDEPLEDGDTVTAHKSPEGA